MTWDASSLATADGSTVEVRVVGQASVDRSVEVGALEWLSASDEVAGPGFYFLRARYYDPAAGRFLSRDLVEFDQRYAYASGNPISYVDMNGLCKRSFNPKDGGDCVVDAADTVRDGVTWCAGDSTCSSVVGTGLVVGGTATGQPWAVGAGAATLTANDIKGCVGDHSVLSCAFVAADAASLGATALAVRGVTATVAKATLRFGAPHEGMLQFTSQFANRALLSKRFGIMGAVGGTVLGVAERLGLLGNTSFLDQAHAFGSSRGPQKE